MTAESNAKAVSRQLSGKSSQEFRDGVLVANDWFYDNIDSIIEAKERSLQELYDRLVCELTEKRKKSGKA